jgi:hypothetical protein
MMAEPCMKQATPGLHFGEVVRLAGSPEPLEAAALDGVGIIHGQDHGEADLVVVPGHDHLAGLIMAVVDLMHLRHRMRADRRLEMLAQERGQLRAIVHVAQELGMVGGEHQAPGLARVADLADPAKLDHLIHRLDPGVGQDADRRQEGDLGRILGCSLFVVAEISEGPGLRRSLELKMDVGVEFRFPGNVAEAGGELCWMNVVFCQHG